jgi:hypothetical protein
VMQWTRRRAHDSCTERAAHADVDEVSHSVKRAGVA